MDSVGSEAEAGLHEGANAEDIVAAAATVGCPRRSGCAAFLEEFRFQLLAAAADPE